MSFFNYLPVKSFTEIVSDPRKNFLKRALVSGVRRCARSKYAAPLISEYVSQSLKPIGDAGTREDTIKLLVLNEERYRADLRELAIRPDVTLYSLPSKVQHLVNSIWVSDLRGISADDPDAYLKSSSDFVRDTRTRLHGLISVVLKRLSSKHNLHGLVSCTFYYRQDREWESAGSEVGVPFFVLHKENMKDPVTHDKTIARYKRKHFRFRGERLFLANELEAEVIKRANCANEADISVVGALRMDTLYRRIQTVEKPMADRKKIVLFSTHHRIGLLEIDGVPGLFNPRRDEGFVKHFSELHGAFAEIALARPQIDFVIKAKWLGPWEEEIESSIFKRVGKFSGEIPNLVVTDTISAQELIHDARAVVALNSTTILEARLAGVPVILPLFEEAATKYFATNVYFQKYLNSFDIADSPESLVKALSAISDGQIPKVDPLPDSMVREYLGYFDGGVTDRVVAEMKSAIKCRYSNRSGIYL